LIAKLYFYKVVYISVSRFINALHKKTYASRKMHIGAFVFIWQSLPQ